MDYADRGKLGIVYGDVTLGVHGEDFHLIFSYQTGGLESMVKHGKEWLYRTPKPTFWRATTDNDRGNGFPFRAGMWMTADMFQKCVDIQVRIDGTKIEKPSAPVNNKYSDKETAERVEVIFTYETLTVPSTQVKVSYLVFADGNVRVRAHYYGKEGMPAANIISAQVIMKPNCVLGLATGSTPIGTYDQLVEWYNKGDLDFSEVTTVNLDEYKGLPRTNDQSYYYFMHQHLFDRVNINPKQTNVPNGMEPDAEKECGRYEGLIHSLGGVDLQLLGLGHNGHIGFNEPGEAFEKETHCVDLTESTIEANKRFFASAEDVPKQAYTMGIKTIMQAKKILVVVNGEAKADIVERAFFGPVTPEVPASILQMHNDVTLVGDEAALAKIVELHAEVLK